MIIDLSNEKLYNPIYLRLLGEKRRYILLYGGRDSAKSYFAAQKVIIDTMRKDYSRIILVRKVFADIKDSQLQTIKDILKAWGLLGKFTINENPIRITCIHNGNLILARGLDKEAKTKSIKDPTGVWYEEANEIKYNDFIKTSTSLRGGILQEIMTFNPEMETEWINNYFFPAKESYEKDNGEFDYVESIRKDAVILHTTYKHNMYCTPQSAEMLEGLRTAKDENFYRIYTLGLWGGVLEGVIFNNWKIVKQKPERFKYIGVGLDWGFTNDPTAVIKVYQRGKQLYIKQVMYAREKGNDEIIFEMRGGGVQKTDEIIADSAEPKSISYLYNKGWNIQPAVKGPGSVNYGIDLIKGFDLLIDEKATGVISELKNYRWRMNKNGESLNIPIDKNNHAMDALRYVAMNMLDEKKERIMGWYESKR